MADKNPIASPAAPQPVLDLKDAVALIGGIVVGAGILKQPPPVEANTGAAGTMIDAWIPDT